MEGKGKMHYTRENNPDSIAKGYWSGNRISIENIHYIHIAL